MEQFEKVCKGLECCLPETQEQAVLSCADCPYDPCSFSVSLPVSLIDDVRKLITAQQERIKELEAARSARVMTLEEAMEAVSKKGGFVWMEQKSHPLCESHVSPSNSIYDCPQRKFKDYGKRFIPKKNSFRFMWRCWTSCPTDEQLEAVKWDAAE